MIRIQNIKLQPNEDKERLVEKACKKLRLDKKSITECKIVKQSLDARNKGNIFFIYTIDVEVANESKEIRSIKDKDVSMAKNISYKLPSKKISCCDRPVIVGFGPAGMFAALTLCQMGFKPIVLERGKSVENRTADVEKFWKTGVLNISSNVQFGEGGAGTFSDGKLTARSKDTRSTKVFDEFVAAGAPEEILYAYNPHIGTDKLRFVVKNIREKIIEMGAEVRFESQVTEIVTNNGEIKSVIINGKEELPCTELLLALGHSARDTFEMLYEKGVKLSQKPFAVGVRIEHLQSDINKAQFGDFADNKTMGAAEYKLTCTTKSGRGAYTFCMCPGGHVVAAASEEGMIAVNGMSYYKRDGKNANSALLVQVKTEDFENAHPLAGMYFQRDLEKKAFEMGGGNYTAPSQTLGNFMNAANNNAIGEIESTYEPKVKLCDLNELFPKFICDAMKEAVEFMGKRLKGFDNKNALLTAVESRSSAPVRIDRDLGTGESINIKGIYPVGEGAGYAGGIVSAAIDGILAAERIYEKYKLI